MIIADWIDAFILQEFMKKKQIELIKYLTMYTKPQKSAEIANALNISTRSVKKYVSEINFIYNKKIILSSKNGYEINRLICTNPLINQKEDQIPQTNEERGFYIIKQLILEHTSNLDLFDLCDYLCVSYSTIKSTITKMNKTFASYNVKFICENDCVKIIGDELNKRKLISYVISEENDTNFIGMNQLKEYFHNIDIDNLRKIVTCSFKSHNFYLNDFAAINLLLHLLIIIDRQSNGNQLNSGNVCLDIDNKSEEALILSLCKELEKEFQIHLNQFEQFEIYMLFKSTANYFSLNSKDEIIKIVGKESITLTMYYIKQINSLYLINLDSDAFITAFSLHLKNLLFRMKTGHHTNNPMAESIRINIPIVFDIAIYIGLDLMERYNTYINEDEISFLAMHIGAEIERQNLNQSKIPAVLLCPDYINISVDLGNKLLLNFGNQINIIRSVNDENDLEGLSFTILFTTIPLSKSYDFNVVQLSPFNLNSQYEIIHDAILQEQDKHNKEILRDNFHIFFENDLFVTNPKIETKDQVLAQLCNLLYHKNYVDYQFEEKVYKRENAATTAFGNIAIPHSIDMDAIKTSVAVAISKKGIQWESNTVHLVFLLAINKADKNTFRELYESLISLFSKDTLIQEIRNCTSFKDFRLLIYNYIDKC